MKRSLYILILFPFLLGSCLGINADIALNQNGSGTIALEYLVSASLDSLGKLDGNERWNTIPVGKADFERTVDRLPDIKLLSYSSKDEGKDLRITAKMEFKDLNGLVSFFDAGGRRSVFSGDGGSGRMILTLNDGEGMELKNSPFGSLIAEISAGYSVRLSMTFPGEGNLNVTDLRGRPVTTTGSQIRPAGKTVSCSFPLYEVLSSTEGINIEFHW